MATKEKTAIEPIKTQIVEYSATAAGLAELQSRMKGVVYVVATPEGMAAAIKDRAECRNLRVGLEKIRVREKAPALERCRLIDAEAKLLTGEIEVLENNPDQQIKAEEARKEAIKQAKIDAERKAAEAVIAAQQAKCAEEERKAKEAEQAKMAAERAEIERVRAEQAETQRRLDAEAKAARERIEAAERESRLKIEAQERAARAEQEAKELAAKKVREAEEEKLRIERERIEAAKREFQRQENMRLDGRDMLTAFVKQYGEVAEFAGVCKEINSYFASLKKESNHAPA